MGRGSPGNIENMDCQKAVWENATRPRLIAIRADVLYQCACPLLFDLVNLRLLRAAEFGDYMGGGNGAIIIVPSKPCQPAGCEADDLGEISVKANRIDAGRAAI